MEKRYNRNRIYVTEEEQNKIKNYHIFLGGAGIGSVLAECALRMGFEHFTIVDGDKVELSNLNRQNYTESDLGHYKAKSLAERLLRINPEAKIEYRTCFIEKNNIKDLLEKQNVAINALDFNSDIPFLFDELCKKRNIPVVHPYNFGWAGFSTLVTPNGMSLKELSNNYQGFELQVAKHIINFYASIGKPQIWLEKILLSYKAEKEHVSPPQLAIASWITAGLCTNILYNLATQKPLKAFPEFYFSSAILNIH